METDEFPQYEKPQFVEPTSHRRSTHRKREQWSADQWLDPLVLVATAPMVYFPDRFPREAFLIAVALLLVPYVVRISHTGRISAYSPIVWPVLVMAVLILPISAITTPDLWGVSWGEFVRFVWGLALLMGVLNWSASGRLHVHRDGTVTSLSNHINLATLGWVAVGLAFTVVGILALRSSPKMPLIGEMAALIPEAPWLPESIAQGFNSNRVAGLVVVFLPFTMSMVLARYSRHVFLAEDIAIRIAFILALTLFGGALLLTQSRSGLLAAAIAVTLVGLLIGWRGLVPIALMGIIVVAALDVFGGSNVMDTLTVDAGEQEQTSPISRILADRNVAGRRVIWQRAIYGIRDDPLTGMGIAGFEVESQKPYERMPEWQPDTDVVHSHNLYLQTALDLGIPGLLLLLAIIGIAAWHCFELYITSRPDSYARYWAAGVFGSLTAFALYNMLDAVSVGARPALAYWYLLGLIAGTGAVLQAAKSGKHTRSRHSSHR